MASLMELPCTNPTTTVSVGRATAYIPNTALALLKLDDGKEFTYKLF